jgi:hypothetical protein
MTTTTVSDVQAAVKPQVQKIVASGEDIRRQLTKVVSEAACRCQETGEGFVELTQSVIEGARAGLEKSLPKDRDDVVRQVVDALGDGLSQTALAARLAVEEAVSSSRRFAEQDVGRLRDDLTAIRELFEETVTKCLQSGKALTESQIASAKTHASRVAERMAPICNEVAEVIRKNPATFARESLEAGVSAGQGAAASLREALSRSLKRAAEELDRAGKPRK